MSSSCSGNCSTCSSSCEKKDLHIPANPMSNIGKVIGVVSGKGGVGKSLVTSLCAVAAKTKGYNTAVLDADITGPSIPKAFGIKGMAEAGEAGLFPRESKMGIKVMSVNLLLDDEEKPVIWRGPVISGMVQQFWQEVIWGDVDYMFVDMPPGTGDVSLTVFQSLPLNGIIVVTTPQDLVTMIVKKAYNMAKMMNIPIIGVVENMSYLECPDCKKKINIFGESKADEIAKQLGVPVLAKLPINPATASLVDKGAVELADTDDFKNVIETIEKI
ncbi:MAG: Mrp/NBP35 family ATP-binding protein [Ruminococcaceae bacterium]|nr:Mrp/NBP35 family ATP-binding protein [Oscillospiraceae bacterium]